MTQFFNSISKLKYFPMSKTLCKILFIALFLTNAEYASAQEVTFEQGDVLCYNFREDLKCSAIGRVTAADDNIVEYTRHANIIFNFTRFKIMQTGMLTVKDGLYCIGPTPVKTKVGPKSHPQSASFQKAFNDRSAASAHGNDCVQHRKCGDLYIQKSFKDNRPTPRNAVTYRLYKKNDSIIEQLTLHDDTVQNPVPPDCKLLS